MIDEKKILEWIDGKILRCSQREQEREREQFQSATEIQHITVYRTMRVVLQKVKEKILEEMKENEN